MCYDMSVGKIYMQIWFIGRTLASQAGKAGSIPVICFFYCPNVDLWACIFIFTTGKFHDKKRISAHSNELEILFFYQGVFHILFDL